MLTCCTIIAYIYFYSEPTKRRAVAAKRVTGSSGMNSLSCYATCFTLTNWYVRFTHGHKNKINHRDAAFAINLPKIFSQPAHSRAHPKQRSTPCPFIYFVQWDVFDDIDKDDDRRIDESEMTAGLKKLGFDLTEKEAAKLFDAIDGNDGGKVLFDEFCKYAR